MRISDWSSDVCSSDLGSFIVQPQLHAVAVARGRDLHQTPIWGKADRIVDQILDDPGQTAFLAKHHRSSRLRAGEGEAAVALHAAGLPPGVYAGHPSSSIDRAETRARQIGVQPRHKIARASGRVWVCHYLLIPTVSVSFNKQIIIIY